MMFGLFDPTFVSVWLESICLIHGSNNSCNFTWNHRFSELGLPAGQTLSGSCRGSLHYTGNTKANPKHVCEFVIPWISSNNPYYNPRRNWRLVGQTSIETKLSVFRFGCVFRWCVLPGGLAKELPTMIKIPKCLNLTECPLVSHITTYKPDVKKNTPDAFRHVPDLFWRAAGT